MNIYAVTVTFNRKDLLKRTIECLRKNSPISKIVVVNNGSTDGTGEWLASQEDLIVITQENVGGSGGFYTGIKYAYEAGADWIWCMDDDVFPREDCLEKLLEDISFNIPDMEEEKIVIDQEYVKEKFAEKIHAEDIDKYIL